MMTRAILSWAGCALAVCLSLTQRLPAQLPVTVPPPSARVCDQAASVVAKGRIDYGAFHTLLACETVGANAFAAGIPKLANLSDTAKLDDFMTVADNWSDATILSAATTLANNASATAQARVFAVRHLITRLQPSYQFTYAGLAMGTDTTTLEDGSQKITNGCRGTMTSARWGTIPAAPLPANYETQIRATLSALAASYTAPAPVRNAAGCVLPPEDLTKGSACHDRRVARTPRLTSGAFPIRQRARAVVARSLRVGRTRDRRREGPSRPR